MGALASFHVKRYARLLSRTAPRIIETDEENERMIGEVERLMDKGARRTPEEEALMQLLVSLIQDFEEKRYPIPDAPPAEMLVYLMERRGLRQADLLPIFGSRGYVSDVVNGRRAISRTHVKKLAEFFHVPADLFL